MAFDPPPPALLRGVLVGPLLPGSNKHALHFAAGPAGTALPHLRRRPGDATPPGLQDIAQPRAPTPAEEASAQEVAGPTLYAGALFDNFGHFVAESIHRLYARRHLPGLAHAPVVLHGRARQRIGGWMAQVLRACDVDPAEVLLLDGPTRFEALHVPMQARILTGMQLIEGYETVFPLVDLPEPGGPGPIHVYLSRSGHLFSGGYLGEGLVERILAEAGVRVLAPEGRDLFETLGLLRAADTILLPEGSALHNLELTGRVGGRVLLIARRGGTRDRFREILDRLARSWELYDEFRSGGVLEWDRRNDRPMIGRSLSYVSIPRLLGALARFTGLDLRRPSAGEIREEVERALDAYLGDPRATRAGTTSAAQLDLLRADLEDLRRRNIPFASG